MRGNYLPIIFIVLFTVFISSLVFAVPGIDGGDECSGSRGKSSFCCTVNHSGSMGDCEDVVINNIDKKCAFVEDINKCEKLPVNWQQAEEIEFWGKVCPSLDYEWAEKPLDCTEKIIDINSEDSLIDISKDNQQTSNLNSYLLIPAGLIVLTIVGWFLLRKRLK